MQPSAKSKWKDPIIISTIIIAVAAVANLIVAALMWSATQENTELTRDIFKAANRPYVGIDTIGVEKDDENERLRITIELKNVGNVPAREVTATWEIIQDGKAIPRDSDKTTKYTVLFPQMAGIMQREIRGDEYQPIVSGKTILEMDVKVKYKGFTEEPLYYRSEFLYNYETNNFPAITSETQ